MDISIKEMQVILTIFKQGGITKAAQILFLTQPTISRIVMRIESNLGAKIFDRSNHPWILTPVGKLFVDKSKKCIELETEFQEKASKLIDAKEEGLSIGVLHFEEKHIIPKVLTDFYKKYPDVKVKFFSGSTSDLEKAVLNGEVEFSLLVLPLINKNIQYEVVKKYNILLALSKSDPLAKNYKSPKKNQSFPKIKIQSLNEHPFIFLNKKNNIRTDFLNACKKIGFQPNRGLEVEKIEIAHHFARMGHGVAFVLDAIEKSPDMAYFMIEETEASQTIAFGYKKDKKFNVMERHFLEILKRVLQE